MAMVDRYKKSGGFVQLLKVIETCNLKKRQQLMDIISSETPLWADALNEKILTYEKIISWDSEVLMELLFRISSLPFATALKSLPEVEYQKFLAKLSHQEKRKLEVVYMEINPNPAEVSSSTFKVVSETRDLISTGVLNPEKFDKALIIPDNFEALLNKSIIIETATTAKPSNKSTASSLNKSPGKLNHSNLSNVTAVGTVVKDSAKSESIVVGADIKSKMDTKSSTDFQTETRVDVLRSKIIELAQQLAIVLNQNKLMRDELDRLKKEAA